jgi:hypothetical protein
MGCFSGCCGVVFADYPRGESSRSIPLADVEVFPGSPHEIVDHLSRFEAGSNRRDWLVVVQQLRDDAKSSSPSCFV